MEREGPKRWGIGDNGVEEEEGPLTWGSVCVAVARWV